MNKQQISDGIYEGLGRIATEIGKGLLVAVAIVIFGILSFSLIITPIYDHFHNEYCDKHPNECLEYMTSIAMPSCNNLPEVFCGIKNHDQLIGEIDNCIFDIDSRQELCSTSATYYPIVWQGNLCGYQEATAFFELFKENYQGNSSNLRMECE